MTGALDRQIVDVLHSDGRTDATAITAELGAAATTVQGRLAVSQHGRTGRHRRDHDRT